jgi:acyl carrier protein
MKASKSVRSARFVAKYLRVDISRVTDEAHPNDDLHANWLDRLELCILIEDQFSGVEFLDCNDQIETVGDLIGYIQDVRVGSMERRQALAA